MNAALLAWLPIGIALELLLLFALTKRKRRLPTLAAQLLALAIGIPAMLLLQAACVAIVGAE
jgi:hypothetical protein